jgi:hypothetical protein
VTTLTSAPKRVLLGRPLRNESLHQELLPKRIALPVFCSDPLSSNAYATEEILLMLSIGGLAVPHLAPWVALAVVVLLVVVVASSGPQRSFATLRGDTPYAQTTCCRAPSQTIFRGPGAGASADSQRRPG